MEVCSRLEGAYALLIRSARYPNELVACKQGSPLVYGLKRRDPAAANGATNGDATGRDQGGAVSSASRLSASLLGAGGAGTEFWLASDSAALLTHTRDVVVGGWRRGGGGPGCVLTGCAGRPPRCSPRTPVLDAQPLLS
jgi:glucosamine--fructose-6-phosphate aminotransferase (isomerizing)